MPEKEPSFTVTDRRKFTLDGELRPGASTDSPQETHAAAPAAIEEAPATAAAQEPVDLEGDFADEGTMPAPTAEETAEQNAAYKESSRSIDDILARQNPRAKSAGEMTFDRLVQSIYMTAAIRRCSAR